MTREELDFIGSMNMCDEISNEAYKKIVCHCREQEPCEDAISRQAVLDIILKYEESNDERGGFYIGNTDNVVWDIKDLSPVNPLSKDYNTIYYTPQPKTGHWIHTDECDEEWQYRCSKCNMPSRSNAHRFCSNCGSYMYGVEPQESEE